MQRRRSLQGTRIAFALAGVLIAIVPLGDHLVPLPNQAFTAIPLFFALGFYGYYTSVARVDSVSLLPLGIGILGLVVMGVGSFLLAVSNGAPIASVFIIAVPSVTGYVLFTLTMAYFLWTSETATIPKWVPVALIVLPILDPLVNAVLTPILSAGVSITGLSWLLVSVALRSENHNNANPSPANQSTN